MLGPYLPSKQGLFLYFPANAQKQPKLRAFIDTAKVVLGARWRQRSGAAGVDEIGVRTGSWIAP